MSERKLSEEMDDRLFDWRIDPLMPRELVSYISRVRELEDDLRASRSMHEEVRLVGSRLLAENDAMRPVYEAAVRVAIERIKKASDE